MFQLRGTHLLLFLTTKKTNTKTSVTLISISCPCCHSMLVATPALLWLLLTLLANTTRAFPNPPRFKRSLHYNTRLLSYLMIHARFYTSADLTTHCECVTQVHAQCYDTRSTMCIVIRDATQEHCDETVNRAHLCNCTFGWASFLSSKASLLFLGLQIIFLGFTSKHKNVTQI